jgi:antitoxin component YwqK of YwqJK toxin-antitoxin module
MIYITVKDWEEDGLYIFWHENGQKWMEGTLKDGELDGLWTDWYDNGQKRREGTYKDGAVISSKCWDEDGNEIDCDELE